MPFPRSEILDQQPLFPDDGQSPRQAFTKDELNLAEFPFSLPTRRHPKGRSNEIRITVDGVDAEKKPIRREWIVTGSAKHGLPLAIDEEVLLGLTYLLQQDGFRSRHLEFTQHQLFRFLGWQTDSRRSYDRLHQCLLRLLGASIVSHGLFWDHATKCRVESDEGFHLIDAFRLYRRRKGLTPADDPPWEAIMICDNPNYEPPAPEKPFHSSVTFGEALFANIQAGFIKSLDFAFYQSLDSVIGRRLFRYLDKKKHHGLVVQVNLTHLAECLVLTGCRYPSQIKQALESPHRELIERGYLEAVKYMTTEQAEAVVYKIASSDPVEMAVPASVAVIASPSRERPSSSPSTSIQHPDPSPAHPLVAALVTRGITRHIANTLVTTIPADRITLQIEAFDYRVRNATPELSRNPAGFLRRAIEHDFATPRGFISKTERERRRREHSAAIGHQVDEREAARRAEREELDRLEQIFAALPVMDRELILTEAVTRLDEHGRQALERERAEKREGLGHWALLAHRNEILSRRFLDRPSSDGDRPARLPNQRAEIG